jgi:hypothetical protein
MKEMVYLLFILHTRCLLKQRKIEKNCFESHDNGSYLQKKE